MNRRTGSSNWLGLIIIIYYIIPCYLPHYCHPQVIKYISSKQNPSKLIISPSGLTNTFSSLTSNSLLQTTYKRTDITELRAEAEEMSTHPYLMSKNCLEMVLGYTTKLYHEFGGADNPNLFSIQVLRMMPRPFINFNTDPFSDVINLNL